MQLTSAAATHTTAGSSPASTSAAALDETNDSEVDHAEAAAHVLAQAAAGRRSAAGGYPVSGAAAPSPGQTSSG